MIQLAIGTNVPYCGAITRVDTYLHGKLKGKTFYTMIDEYGAITTLEHRDVRIIMADVV